MSKLALMIQSRERDLGGFSVRRLLPYATHRMVGPYIFFDHMGPATFPAGEGMDVRPHPHIHLATVTYLFEGAILHRDSLGSEREIRPGAINWMTAGRGIVHSERTPPALRAAGSRLHGIQLWVALPEAAEDSEPSFVHHPAEDFPEFQVSGARVKVLLGEIFGHKSPVATKSDLFYADAVLPRGTKLTFPAGGRETGFYLVSGKLRAEEQTLSDYSMGIAATGADLELEAQADSRVMLFGGSPVGKRFIEWNFVSSSQAKVDQAKADWAPGPGSARFPKIPGDDREFIPLPEDCPKTKGTIL
jgi:redox-sensitive bicupin YhaK (pirin superfamily)